MRVVSIVQVVLGVVAVFGVLRLWSHDQRAARRPSFRAKEGGRIDRAGLSSAQRSINRKRTYDVCVVGAGLSGAVFAERYATVLQKSVLVMDKRNHFGGNCYDYVDEETGIRVNKYGAHLFHTNSEKAWHYVNMHKGAPRWVRWDHEVLGSVRGKLVTIPVNINTVNRLFDASIKTPEEMDKWLAKVQVPCPSKGCENAEQMAKSRVGDELFREVFRDYTLKQWNKEPRDLDPLVTARIPVRNTFDARYFSDRYQALPSEGYTSWFEALLSRPQIDLVLGVDFFDERAHLEGACGKIIYTGPIDSFFADAGLGELEYRSIRFEEERHFNMAGGFFQPNSVVNYPSGDVPFTRAVEYKHFLHQDSAHTIIVREYPSDVGEPYYPVPNPRNLALYERYRSLAEQAERTGDVHFVGRLANYKYFNMDQAIVNALDMFYEIAGRPRMEDMASFYPGG